MTRTMKAWIARIHRMDKIGLSSTGDDGLGDDDTLIWPLFGTSLPLLSVMLGSTAYFEYHSHVRLRFKVVEMKYNTFRKSTTANEHPCEARNLSGFFHNFGNVLRPLELVPASCERVVPTERQVRAVLGDCMSRAKVIPTQAPQCRQYAHPSIREEAALATNWIKDRPEGLKLQNLALATMTRPASSSFPKFLTADIQYIIYKCESLGSGQQLILHGNPSVLGQDFPRIWQSFDVFFFFCRMCTSSAVCCFRALSVAILTSLRPAVNPLPGCSSRQPVQDQLV